VDNGRISRRVFQNRLRELAKRPDLTQTGIAHRGKVFLFLFLFKFTLRIFLDRGKKIMSLEIGRQPGNIWGPLPNGLH
jgi:hypothetical protein